MEDIQTQLDELDRELKEGDITEKGWQKKRSALLSQLQPPPPPAGQPSKSNSHSSLSTKMESRPEHNNNETLNTATENTGNSGGANKKAVLSRMSGYWKSQQTNQPPKGDLNEAEVPPPPRPIRPNPWVESKMSKYKAQDTIKSSSKSVITARPLSIADSTSDLADTSSVSGSRQNLSSQRKKSSSNLISGVKPSNSVNFLTSPSTATLSEIADTHKTPPKSPIPTDQDDSTIFQDEKTAMKMESHRFGTITKRLNVMMKSNRESAMFPRPISKHPGSQVSTDETTEKITRQVQEPRLFKGNLHDEVLKVGLDTFTSIVSVVRARASLTPRAVALIAVDSKGKESTMTYEKLNGRAEKVGYLLREKSVAHRNNPIGLLYRSSESIEFLIALFGCFYAGIPCVPIHASNLDDISKSLINLQVSLVMSTEGYIKVLNKEIYRSKTVFPAKIEWWLTDGIGSYSSKKKGTFEYDPMETNKILYYECAETLLGDFTAVAMTQKVITKQCIAFKSLHEITANDVIFTNLDPRHSFGLLHVLLQSVFTGSTALIAPSSHLSSPILWFQLIKKYQVTITAVNEPKLHGIVEYVRQLTEDNIKRILKSESHNLSSLRYVFVNFAAPYVRPNPKLLQEAFKHLTKFNMDKKHGIIPMVTLHEFGGVLLSTRSKADETLEHLELGIDRNSLAINQLNVQLTGAPDEYLLNFGRQIIRVCDVGMIIPETKTVIVNHKTCTECRSNEIGEIWLSQSNLPFEYFGEEDLAKTVFNSVMLNQYKRLDDNETYLRTKCFGFMHENRVYITGSYGERIGDFGFDDTEQNIHYTVDINKTVQDIFNQVELCVSFGITLNDEELIILAVETKPQSKEEYLNMARFMIETVIIDHLLHIYCVILCPKGSIPRDTDGNISIPQTRKFYDLGLLDALYVYMNVRGSSKKIFGVRKENEDGQEINKMAANLARAMNEIVGNQLCDGNLIGNIGQGFGAVDRPTNEDLLQFENITSILYWRSNRRPDDIALISLDLRGKDVKKISFGKLNDKIARMAFYLQKKNLKIGNYALLIFTNCLEFIISLHACIYLGITAIIFPDNNGLISEHEIPILLKLIDIYDISAILTTSSVEESLKHRSIVTEIKSRSAALETRKTLPDIINVSKAPKATTHMSKEQILLLKHQFSYPVLQVKEEKDDVFEVFELSHETIIAQSVMIKEACNLNEQKPLISCGRHSSGIGFLNSCILGIYVGCPTVVISQNDFATNPQIWFDALSKYQVKDTFVTYPMLEFGIENIAADAHLYLQSVQNIQVCSDNRSPFTEAASIVLEKFKLDVDTLSSAYSPVHHPCVSSRSYLKQESVVLWIDLEQMRRQIVHVVEPNSLGSILVHDSGRVMPCTTVAVTRVGTNQLCDYGEIGEIWISSPASVDGIVRHKSTKNDIPVRTDFNQSIDCSLLPASEKSEVENAAFVNTGDIGFLYQTSITCFKNGQVSRMNNCVMFVLGKKSDVIEIQGKDKGFKKTFIYFPLDIEESIECSHPAINHESTVVFYSEQSGGLCAVVELKNPDHNSLNCISVIVNAVLDDHQLGLAVLIFVAERTEKQSHKISKAKGKFRSQIQYLYESGKLEYHSVHNIQ